MYKVIKEFGCAQKGDVLHENEEGLLNLMWSVIAQTAIALALFVLVPILLLHWHWQAIWKNLKKK